jgi:hypothetical protein
MMFVEIWLKGISSAFLARQGIGIGSSSVLASLARPSLGVPGFVGDIDS